MGLVPVDDDTRQHSSNSTIATAISFENDSQNLFDVENVFKHSNPVRNHVRSRSVSMSIISTSTASDEADSNSRNNAHSSNPEERHQSFESLLTLVASCIYGVFAVTFGVVVKIQGILTDQSQEVVDIFGIYLLLVGTAYIIFLKFHVRNYLLQREKRRKSIFQARPTEVDLKENKLSTDWDVKPNGVMHDYCFTSGRHSGSFYLKCGAAVFCFGLVIHSASLVAYQSVSLMSQLPECGSTSRLVRDIWHPIFTSSQLYFVFKHASVIINRYEGLARFAIMHCIATSICFWAWTILDETMDAIKKYEIEQYKYTNESSTSSVFNITTTLQCENFNGITNFFSNFSTYLYPFTIEFSILVGLGNYFKEDISKEPKYRPFLRMTVVAFTAAIMYVMWHNIGRCTSEVSGVDDSCNLVEYETKRALIQADCTTASKGLFGGVFVVATSVLTIIIVFVVMSDKAYVGLGLLINTSYGIIILLIMTVASVFAYRSMRMLDVNTHPVSFLDDILLFACIPAYFMYAIFSIPASMGKQDFLGIIKIVLQVAQVLIQTPLIMDGLRRCSNSKQLRRLKPGKQLITFLIICNLSMWMTETFQIKTKDSRYDMYGYVLWILIKHMCVPLQMFYRFHSSVCLVDIWKSAYKSA